MPVDALAADSALDLLNGAVFDTTPEVPLGEATDAISEMLIQLQGLCRKAFWCREKIGLQSRLEVHKRLRGDWLHVEC